MENQIAEMEEVAVIEDQVPPNPYKCNVCKRSFEKLSGLENHQEKHDARKLPFVCDRLHVWFSGARWKKCGCMFKTDAVKSIHQIKPYVPPTEL
ncbi:hypothetical protein FRX31_025974 [Thalictrum thalictroides]|uniref:C2H2-type domain-containing protein n=1 Tax=Thalictrum thalictroides TaxID=46969 RepID=A0A7J6VK09_THATH|nr:hypothetical protein FRX31_025974 [Thalictrum thalictroides]